MTINDSLKKLKEMIDLTLKADSEKEESNNEVFENSSKFPLVGKYVILRCYYAGVHAGFLAHYDPVLDMAILNDSRRLEMEI